MKPVNSFPQCPHRGHNCCLGRLRHLALIKMFLFLFDSLTRMFKDYCDAHFWYKCGRWKHHSASIATCIQGKFAIIVTRSSFHLSWKWSSFQEDPQEVVWPRDVISTSTHCIGVCFALLLQRALQILHFLQEAACHESALSSQQLYSCNATGQFYWQFGWLLLWDGIKKTHRTNPSTSSKQLSH